MDTQDSKPEISNWWKPNNCLLYKRTKCSETLPLLYITFFGLGIIYEWCRLTLIILKNCMAECSTHMSDSCLESLHTQLSQYEVCWFVYKSLIWSRTHLMFEFSLQYSYQLGNHQVLNASNDVTNFPWLLLPDSIYAFFLVLFHTSSKQI